MPHSGQNDGVATLNRRNFLRLGLGSATLLAGASLTANLSGCSSSDAPAAENTASGYRYQFLTADDLTLFRALLPAIVGPSLPPEQSPQQSAIEGTIQNIDSGIVHFSRANRFLARWRDSSIGLFNNGYIALIKITNVAFYGNPAHWEVSRYPGPPKWAVDALPQFQSPA